MDFTLPPQLNLNRRAVCDFFIGKRIKYNREYAGEAHSAPTGAQSAQNLHEMSVKRADLGRFDGQDSAE
jgi:hypothetical protein